MSIKKILLVSLSFFFVSAVWGNVDKFVRKESWNYQSFFSPRCGEFHNGLDIGGIGNGAPLYAIEDGTITAIFNQLNYYFIALRLKSKDEKKVSCGGMKFLLITII